MCQEYLSQLCNHALHSQAMSSVLFSLKLCVQQESSLPSVYSCDLTYNMHNSADVSVVNFQYMRRYAPNTQEKCLLTSQQGNTKLNSIYVENESVTLFVSDLGRYIFINLLDFIFNIVPIFIRWCLQNICCFLVYRADGLQLLKSIHTR